MEFLAQFHPKLVHFPIVLLIMYALFETGGVILKKDFLSKSAYIILVMAVIASLAAVLTGDQALKIAEAWDEKGLKSDDLIIPFGLIHKHEFYASLTLWYFAALLVARTILVIKKKFTGYFKFIVVALAVIGCGFLFKTGDLGGQLVFKHGVGTELIKPVDSTSAAPQTTKIKEE